MFFRNLLVYRLTRAIDLSPDTLEEALAAKPARPCGSQEISTYGFVAPIGKGENAPLVHASSGFLLIATRKEERNLPASVVKDAVKEKVDQIEAEQLRKVYKNERDQIKDDIVQAFLPRAFIRKASTFAAIMPEQGLIVVDSASAKRAEDLLSTLREAIGSLPVRPISVRVAPTATLTEWIRAQEAPDDFTVLDQAQLTDTHEDGGSIIAKRQDLSSDEIQNHVGAGKQVSQLALAWQDKLSFVLDDKLVIKRLRFEDLLQDQAEQDGGDDALSQQDASFTLMCLTFADFLPALLDALGGEEIPQGIDGPGYESRLEARAPSKRTARAEVQLDVLADLTATSGGGFGDETDPLFKEALEFVRSSRRASISAIQRRLKIGYNRAARMIETMELHGIVTAMNSNGHRDVMGGAV